MSLALHNVSQADPLTQETLAALLPQSVAADLGTGEHIDLELTWDLSARLRRDPQGGRRFGKNGCWTPAARLSQAKV